MRRIVVLGGAGVFGAAAVQLLRAEGLAVLVASRRREADIRVDVEDPSSVRAALAPGDVVLDAVGPYQDRSTTLVEAALEVRFDVVDISDAHSYAKRLLALEGRIEAAGIRVLTSCSSLSAVSAAMIGLSGIEEPTALTCFLAPASRYTANSGAAASLLRSVGRPIRLFRDGRFAEGIGWRERRTFPLPPPIGNITARGFESVDALLLPPLWPSLRRVEMYVHSQVPGLDRVLDLASRNPAFRGLVERFAPAGMALARMLGKPSGCLAYEIVGGEGKAAFALVASQRGHFTPIVPAVLATGALARGDFAPKGLVPPDRHVEPSELFARLKEIGVSLWRLQEGPQGPCWLPHEMPQE